MDNINAKILQVVEKDECDSDLEARGSLILEQIAILKAQVANSHDSQYILSEEELASIESECRPRASGLAGAMTVAQEKFDAIVGEARQLAARVEAEKENRRGEEDKRREEGEKSKPPPDAPTAPKGK